MAKPPVRPPWVTGTVGRWAASVCFFYAIGSLHERERTDQQNNKDDTGHVWAGGRCRDRLGGGTVLLRLTLNTFTAYGGNRIPGPRPPSGSWHGKFGLNLG
jgi:hypothetical protein